MPGSQIIDIFVWSDNAKIVNGIFHFSLVPKKQHNFNIEVNSWLFYPLEWQTSYFPLQFYPESGNDHQ